MVVNQNQLGVVNLTVFSKQKAAPLFRQTIMLVKKYEMPLSSYCLMGAFPFTALFLPFVGNHNPPAEKSCSTPTGQYIFAL